MRGPRTEEEDVSVMAERPRQVEMIEESGLTSAKRDRPGWRSRRERTVEQTRVQRTGSRNPWHVEGQ